MSTPRSATSTSKMSIQSLLPSKWLFQASPPDQAEGSTRWTFGLYEILDNRNGPFDPRVLHTTYRGVIELEPNELPKADDPQYAPKLEDTLVTKYKALLRR
jgi:hypothetical protein